MQLMGHLRCWPAASSLVFCWLVGENGTVTSRRWWRGGLIAGLPHAGRFWTLLDAGRWTLDAGRWTLDAGRLDAVSRGTSDASGTAEDKSDGRIHADCGRAGEMIPEVGGLDLGGALVEKGPQMSQRAQNHLYNYSN